jgi:hypothetical protein
MKRLTNIVLLLLLAVTTAASGAAARLAQSPPAKAAEKDAKSRAEAGTSRFNLQRDFKALLPIPLGEKLVYEVKFSRFPISATVGEVSFEFLGLKIAPIIQGLDPEFKVNDSEQFIHLRAEAISKGFLTSLLGIDVKDRFEALVETRAFTTRLGFKEIREGQRHQIFSALLDNEKLAATYLISDLTRSQATTQRKELAIESGSLDLLWAFYAVQLQRLKEGQLLRFPVVYDAETYEFEIAIHGRERLKTDFGQLRAIKLEPKLFGPGKFFSREGEMFMWMSDDERQVPLRLIAKTGGNTITADLIRVEQRCQRDKRKK